MDKIKPRVFISRCIEQQACRWNEAIIASPEIRQMLPYIEVINACPEADIGLGIPRDPVRLEMHGDNIRLVQPATQKDLTDQMVQFALDHCRNFSDIDGFILKSKSPSCGNLNVKVYSGPGSKGKSGFSSGIFCQVLKDQYPFIVLEDEGRLTNLKIREHFLTRIFTQARFREIEDSGKMRDLVDFHSRHKYLYMSYNQTEMRNLGKITGNLDKKSIPEVYKLYAEGLKRVFRVIPRFASIVNVWMHIMGYFSDQLSAGEKQNLLLKMEQYKEDRIPAVVVSEILYSLAIRFDQKYILDQYFFYPFPVEIMTAHDSGKRRL